jgi:hypothetical protein
MPRESETLVILNLFQGRIFEAHLAGKFEQADYRTLLSHTRHLIEQHGSIRMLLHLHRFEGWENGARWSDLAEPDLSALARVAQLAVVGPEHSQAGLALFLEPFKDTHTKFFSFAERQQSRRWIDDGLEPSGRSGAKANE